LTVGEKVKHIGVIIAQKRPKIKGFCENSTIINVSF